MRAIAAEFSGTPVSAPGEDNVLLDMWEKFVMITAMSGMNCLMRGNIGEIAATEDGADLTNTLSAPGAEEPMVCRLSAGGNEFEPSVPLLRKALLGVANRRRRHERRSHLQVQVRNGNACLEWLPTAFPFAEGPRVRVRLPPAVSPANFDVARAGDGYPQNWTRHFNG